MRPGDSSFGRSLEPLGQRPADALGLVELSLQFADGRPEWPDRRPLFVEHRLTRGIRGCLGLVPPVGDLLSQVVAFDSSCSTPARSSACSRSRCVVAARSLRTSARRSGRYADADRAAEVAAPRTWLLSKGWRRIGLVDPAEVPAR